MLILLILLIIIGFNTNSKIEKYSNSFIKFSNIDKNNFITTLPDESITVSYNNTNWEGSKYKLIKYKNKYLIQSKNIKTNIYINPFTFKIESNKDITEYHLWDIKTNKNITTIYNHKTQRYLNLNYNIYSSMLYNKYSMFYKIIV